jgi:phage FluMu gp28-like protein
MKSSEFSNTPAQRASYFLPYQLAWLADKSRYKIMEKSRRIGGDYVQSFEDVTDLVDPKQNIPAVYYSSADLTAAAEYIRYCRQWALIYNAVGKSQGPGFDVVDEQGIKTFMLELKNGKRIHALSSNPKAFRSKGGKLGLSEFAFHDDDEEMWKAAKPIVTWGYPVRIISSHNGEKRKFNRFIKDIRKGKLKWALHTITIQKAVADGLADKIVGRKLTEAERQEWLDAERASCGDDATWLQEYCCQPMDENSAFLTYERLFAIEREGILSDLSDVQGDLYLGMDVSRRRDLSVIYVLELLSHILFVRKIEVMEKTSFSDQKKILYPLLAHPKMRRACIDDTGLGMQLAEEAQQEFGRFKVEAVTFTPNVKSELAYGLYTDIEDKTLYHPPDDVARESLHSVRKLVTEAGNIRFDAERSEKTGHGDHFWGLGLARHAARDRASGEIFAESGGSENSRNFMDAFHPFSRRDLLGY